MTSDRPTVPRMFPSILHGWNWPGIRPRALRPSSSVRRSAPRARFRVEELESRWLLSTTEVNLKAADTFFLLRDNAEPNLSTFTQLSNVAATVPASSHVLPDANVAVDGAGEDDETYVPVEGFATAIALPNAPSVEVKGTHSPGDAPDMLMIPVNSSTGVIKLTLKSGTAGQPLFEALRVVDSWNHELANTTPGPNTMSIDVRLPVWGQNATAVYVQISFQPPGTPGTPATPGSPAAPPPGGSGNPGDGLPQTAFPYVLEVTRVPAPPVPVDQTSVGAAILASWEQFLKSSSVFNNATGTPVVVNVPKVTPPDSSPPPPPPSQPEDPPSVPTPPRETTPDSLPPPLTVPISVGPLPLRSAAPPGGVLAMSDPVPEVDPHQPARAELATFDPTLDLMAMELRVELAERQVLPVSGPEAAAESLPMVVGGPGGLPLLATALIAGPVDSSATNPEAVPQPATELVMAASVAPLQLEATATHPSAAAPATEPSEAPVQARRTRRAAVLPGVTLALALGVGLMLPDLVAAFQFSTPTRLRVRIALIRRAFRFGLS